MLARRDPSHDGGSRQQTPGQCYPPLQRGLVLAAQGKRWARAGGDGRGVPPASSMQPAFSAQERDQASLLRREKLNSETGQTQQPLTFSDPLGIMLRTWRTVGDSGGCSPISLGGQWPQTELDGLEGRNHPARSLSWAGCGPEKRSS